MTLARELKKYEKQWKEAEQQELGQFAKLPDGDYTGKLTAARIELAKASGRLQIAWPLMVIGGKQDGRRITKYDGLDNELSMSYAKGLMSLLGMDAPESILELPGAIEKYFKHKKDGVPVNFTVVTKDSFTNIYINGLAEEEEGDKEKEKEKEDDISSEYSRKDIKNMSEKDLRKLVKVKDLDIDPDDFEDEADEFRKAVIKELSL